MAISWLFCVRGFVVTSSGLWTKFGRSGLEFAPDEPCCGSLAKLHSSWAEKNSFGLEGLEHHARECCLASSLCMHQVGIRIEQTTPRCNQGASSQMARVCVCVCARVRVCVCAHVFGVFPNQKKLRLNVRGPRINSKKPAKKWQPIISV